MPGLASPPRPWPPGPWLFFTPDEAAHQRAAPFVVLVIGQLFGLNPLAVLTSIARMLRLVSIRQHVVLANEIILQIGHAARPGTFAMIFGARSEMPAVVARHVLDPHCFCGL